MVTRYAIDWYGEVSGDGAIEENPNGPYVLYADYATLRAEIDQLHRERDAIRNETLEEAAKVADDEDGNFTWAGMYRNVIMLQTCAREIASAIRNLKEPSDD